jgi:regulator of vacuolar morphogenesis
MEVSITGYSDNSPTYYLIHVVIQDKIEYVVRRRYSDFDTFATELEQEMGEPAPVALPSKKWIGNRSKEFLDDRRRGLELFLRRLLKKEEWRESLALQKFLETSKHNTKVRSSTKHEPAAEWAKTTSEMRAMIQSARDSQGVERRRLIIALKTKLRELESSLLGDKGLGEGEYMRRRNVILEFTRSLGKIENPGINRFSNDLNSIYSAISGSSGGKDTLDSVSGSGRALFGNADSERSFRRVLGAGGETDRTRQYNNSGLLALQNQDMEDQDKIIEGLRKTIRTQRELGEQIHEELEYQNRLLDDIDQDTHATSAKLNQARRRVKKFT